MQDFDTILHSFVTMYEHQGGYLDLKQMYSSKSPVSMYCSCACMYCPVQTVTGTAEGPP